MVTVTVTRAEDVPDETAELLAMLDTAACEADATLTAGEEDTDEERDELTVLVLDNAVLEADRMVVCCVPHDTVSAQQAAIQMLMTKNFRFMSFSRVLSNGFR